MLKYASVTTIADAARPKKSIAWLVFGLVVAAGGLIAAPTLQRDPAGSTTMVTASLIMLVMVVECSLSRFIKGLVLIGFGVFLQATYLPTFFPPIEFPNFLQEAENQKIVLFNLMITLACGGAGGSLIAAHAEVSSNDRAKSAQSNTQQTSIDYTSQLDELVKNAEAMNTKINGLMCMCGALFVIIALLLLFRSS